MAKTWTMLATSAEVRTLVERAIGVLEEVRAGEDHDRDSPFEADAEGRASAAFDVAREALRFCAAATAQLGDAGLLPLLARAAAALEDWDDHAHGYRDTVLEGVTALLRAGAPVAGLVEDLAAHPDVAVRAAVAAGIRPRGPHESAVLTRLAVDPAVQVRTPAKAALAETGAVPWWMGKFETDPVARLTPDEAMLHKATLEQLSALLDEPYYKTKDRDENLTRLIGALPDPIAVEAARLVLSASERFSRHPKLGAVMVSRPGGIDALLRLCEVWAKARYFHPSEEHVQMVAGAPMPVRLEACLSLARYAAAAPEKVRRRQGGPAAVAAEIAGKAFPPGADLTPLLDLLLGLPEVPEFTLDWCIAGLGDAFRHPDADPTPFAARLVEAQLKGFPGVWRAIHGSVHGMLLRLPRETLRAAAEEAVRRDDDSTASWGMGRLLFEVHDPERDPDPLTMVHRFCEDPRLYRALQLPYDIQHVVVSIVRDGLRRGVLRFREATHAIKLIDDLWGGQASGLGRLHPRHEEEESKRSALRTRFAAFLGPEALHGPVTEEEWAALRRAREAHGTFADRGDWATALLALPPGPWHPEDRAFFDRAVLACSAENDFSHFIAMAITDKPEADLLPLFQQLVRIDPDSRDTFKRCYDVVRDALGLPLVTKGEAAGAAAGPREWMDEPEDEDEDDDDEDDEDDE